MVIQAYRYLALFFGVWSVLWTQVSYAEEETKEEKSKFTLGQVFAFSAIPAFADALGTFPLRAIKLDRQANQATPMTMKAIFRGVLPSSLGVLPKTSLMIGVKELLGSNEDDSTERLIATSATAGAVGHILSTPMDLIVAQQRYHKLPAKDIIQNIRMSNGLLGFSQGFKPAIISGGLNGLGFFFLPNFYADLYKMVSGAEEDPPPYVNMVPAAISVAILTQPVDGIKSAIMRQRLKPGESPMGVAKAYHQIVDEAKSFTGLWKGISWRAAQYVVGFGIADGMRRLLMGYFEASNQAKQGKSQAPKATPPEHHPPKTLFEAPISEQQPLQISSLRRAREYHRIQ